MSNWFSPVPHDYSETRITLDFGLTATTRYYNELIVPKIGSVRTLRAFSYALAGIKLHREFEKKETPTSIAHGIEALANKIYWNEVHEFEDVSVLGINGFKQFPGEWGYVNLLKSYVKSNTMRQSTVSALKSFHLVSGGTFNSFALSKQGEIIADLFLSRKNLNSTLSDWVKGKSIDTSKLRNIASDRISPEEVSQLVSFLCHEDPDGNERRKNLWKVFEKKKHYEALEDRKHVDDIKLVEAFEGLKTELINFYLEIAENNLGNKISDIKISNLNLTESIEQYEKWQSHTGKFTNEVSTLLAKIKNKKDASLVEELMKIESQLIIIDDNKKIQKGNLYNLHRVKSLKRNNQPSELSRLAQLQKLVKESL